MSKFLFLVVVFCSIPFLHLQGQSKLTNTNFLEKIEYELINGKIIIPVIIEGTKCRFIFDTGGLFLISPEIKEKLKLRTIDTGKVSGVNKVKTKIDVVRIGKTQIGTLNFLNYRAIVGDFLSEYPGHCLEVDGLIGRDFIKNMAIQFDQKNKLLYLTDQPHRFKMDGVKASRLSFSQNRLPLIPIKVNGKNMKKVVFDSGSDDLFSMKTNKIKKYRKKYFDKDDLIEVYGNFNIGVSGSTPPPRKQYFVKVEELKIAQSRFLNFTSDVSKLSNSRCGTKLLDYGIMTLDYINRKFYFQEYIGKNEIAELHSFGFTIRIKEKNAIIRSIVSESPAAQLGMECGQKILAIDDHILTNFSPEMPCEFLRIGFPWKNKEVIKVKFMNRSGIIKEVDLEKLTF